jgi:membrane protein YdbS with pleckstrin-like domain
MRNRLFSGEQVIVQSRPQARSLAVPALAFILIPAAAAYLLAVLRPTRFGEAFPQLADWQPFLVTAVLVLAAAGELLYPVRQWLRWAGTLYTLTDRRIILRTGWLSRRRMDIPLEGIRHLQSRQDLLQRLLRSGTVYLDLGIEGSCNMRNVPEVARFREFALAAMRGAGGGHLDLGGDRLGPGDSHLDPGGSHLNPGGGRLELAGGDWNPRHPHGEHINSWEDVDHG